MPAQDLQGGIGTMTSITDQLRERFYALLMAETQTEPTPQPVVSMPIKKHDVTAERHLANSIRQAQSSLAEVARILGERPELATHWRAELLECGRDANYAINQATSRMRMPDVFEHQGRGPKC